MIGHRQCLSQPDAQSISNALRADIGCLHEDSKSRKKIARWPSPQAIRPTTLDRSRPGSIPRRAPLHRPIRFLRRADHGFPHVDVISSPCGPFWRRERGNLNDQHAFDAPARFSLSERALPTAGTSLLLHGPLSLGAHRHHSDVAYSRINPRDGDAEIERNQTGGNHESPDCHLLPGVASNR